MATTVYPSDYDTLTSGSLGTTKVNAEPVVDVTTDDDAGEHNVITSGLRAVQLQLGDGSTSLTQYGDSDTANVREQLGFHSDYWYSAAVADHFTCAATNTDKFVALNTAFSYASVTGGVGVAQINHAVATREGLTQTNYHFHERSSYYRCRWSLTDIPVGAADFLEFGWEDAAAHFVKIHITDPSNGASVWVAEIDNGASSTTNFSFSPPSADTWYDMEILSTSTGATFYINRGQSDEDSVSVVAAPFNGICRPIAACTEAAGAFFGNYDFLGMRDTRTL